MYECYFCGESYNPYKIRDYTTKEELLEGERISSIASAKNTKMTIRCCPKCFKLITFIRGTVSSNLQDDFEYEPYDY